MPIDCSEVASRSSSWVVVNSHPHREHVALVNLDRQGFQSYCPMLLRRVRHARRFQDVLRPLFPGYIFVQVDPDRQRWRPILSTLGVRSLVRFGDSLGFIDDAFIANLKAREFDGAVIKPERSYTIGQEVRLMNGPFDGLIARIVELNDKNRLVVLMQLLNQPVRVKVEERHLSAVQDAPVLRHSTA